MRIGGPRPLAQSPVSRPAAAPSSASAAPTGQAPAPRVFLLHGVDAKGSSDHGRGAMASLAERLRREGYPETRALSYNSDSWLLNQLAVFREQLFGTFSERLSTAILEELERNPLAPGQQISLVGYSLGAQVAAQIARELDAHGVPVATLALIEPKNGNTPAALRTLPRAQKVLVVENQTDVSFKNPYQDTILFHHVPTKNHYEMVERPEESMIRFLRDHLR